MKRTETYLRMYEWDTRKGSHGRSWTEENPKDNIDKKLSEICFHIGNEKSSAGYSIIRKKFLHYSYKFGTEKSTCFINVDKGSSFQKIPENNYVRRVNIEIMPEDGKLPKELTDLLNDEEFLEEEKFKLQLDTQK